MPWLLPIHTFPSRSSNNAVISAGHFFSVVCRNATYSESSRTSPSGVPTHMLASRSRSNADIGIRLKDGGTWFAEIDDPSQSAIPLSVPIHNLPSFVANRELIFRSGQALRDGSYLSVDQAEKSIAAHSYPDFPVRRLGNCDHQRGQESLRGCQTLKPSFP